MSETVLKVKLKPDLSKIKQYLNQNDLLKWMELGYVQLELTFNQKEYENYSKQLMKIFKEFRLSLHEEELLYIVFKEDEHLMNQNIDDKLKYDDTQRTIDICNFLLMFQNDRERQSLQIGAKENVGTEFIKKTQSHFIQYQDITDWMFKLIYDGIKKGQHPLHMFGETFFESIAGLRTPMDDFPISKDSLEYGASLSNKSLEVLKKRRQVEFCKNIIKSFLQEHTEMKTPPGMRLTNEQSDFFFELLCSLGHIDRQNVKKPYRNYFHNLFKNYKP